MSITSTLVHTCNNILYILYYIYIYIHIYILYINTYINYYTHNYTYFICMCIYIYIYIYIYIIYYNHLINFHFHLIFSFNNLINFRPAKANKFTHNISLQRHCSRIVFVENFEKDFKLYI